MFSAAVVASTGISASGVSAIVAATVAICAFIGGSVTYFLRRRGSTGTTTTSEAGILWQQSQAMFIQITAERDKAIEQRDRLMQAQADQVIPILSALLSTVQQLKAILDQRDPLFAHIQTVLETLDRRNIDVAPALVKVDRVVAMLEERGKSIDRMAELIERLAKRYGVG